MYCINPICIMGFVSKPPNILHPELYTDERAAGQYGFRVQFTPSGSDGAILSSLNDKIFTKHDGQWTGPLVMATKVLTAPITTIDGHKPPGG